MSVYCHGIAVYGGKEPFMNEEEPSIQARAVYLRGIDAPQQERFYVLSAAHVCFCPHEICHRELGLRVWGLGFRV